MIGYGCYQAVICRAKILKNITQNLIRSNLAGNFTKIMKTLTDILRDEFATESGFKTFVHTARWLCGHYEGLRSDGRY